VSRSGITALFIMMIAAGIMSGSPAQKADATFPGTTASATFPGSNGRIAYTKVWYVRGEPGPDRRSDIFTVRPDGAGNQRLTFSRDAGKPLWSPSGGRIAFERAGAVWVMQSDGSGKQLLTDGQLVGWMPTGGRILVVRGLHRDAWSGADPAWWLYTVATGAEEQLPIDLPIVAGLSPPYDDYSEWSFAAEPTLSPDGELLAFTLLRDDDADSGYSYYHGSFFTVRLDGTDLARVPYYTYSFGAPGWAPDGDELVYWISEPRAPCFDSLRSIHLDGTAGSVDIAKPCTESDPAWSPDGTKIAFVNERSGRLQIARLDGSRIKTVLPRTDGVYRYQPDWRRLR